MQVAVLSGKGGTGKTTIAVNLFNILDNAILLDTDVEEPNTELFLKGVKTKTYPIIKQHPIINYDLCTFCGACGEHCNFNAIIPTKTKVLVYDDLCHDCGLCALVCPQNAISYTDKIIGDINQYQTNHKTYYTGQLKVGEVSGVKIIKALKSRVSSDLTTIIDCPPGVSCSTVEGIEGSDYAIVVTEPTPFGLSDLKMVVELLNTHQISFGVVINKSNLGNDDMHTYLNNNQIPIIEEIPFDKGYAKTYSTGDLISDFFPAFKEKMINIQLYLEGEQYHE